MVHTTFGDVCVDCDQIVRHNDTTYAQGDQTTAQNHTPRPQPRLDVSPIKHSSHIATQGVAYAPPRPAPIATRPSDHPQSHAGGTQRDAGNKDAIGFNQRLRARMCRLVVPELPSSSKNLNSQFELPSALAEPELPAPIDTLAIHASAVAVQEDYRTQNTTQPHTDLAFLQAEAIAEMDTPANTIQTSSSSPEVTDSFTLQNKSMPPYNNPKFLIAGISIATIVVLGAGLWAAQRNAALQHTKKPANHSTTPQRTPVATEVTQRDNQRKTDLNSLATALEVYKQQLGTYPAGDDIKVLYPLQYTTPPYITIVNYDPSSDEDTKIKYNYSSDGTSFTIVARLEDPSDPDAQSGYYVVRNR